MKEQTYSDQQIADLLEEIRQIEKAAHIALAELRARDEAMVDFDKRARWRLEQKPYTGTGEP